MQKLFQFSSFDDDDFFNSEGLIESRNRLKVIILRLIFRHLKKLLPSQLMMILLNYKKAFTFYKKELSYNSNRSVLIFIIIL
jgi:hypothetical protein